MRSPSLTPRSYLWLDRLTKLLGLAAVVVALDGAAGPLSPVVGLAGIALGVATVFVDAPAADPRERPAGDSGVPDSEAGVDADASPVR